MFPLCRAGSILMKKSDNLNVREGFAENQGDHAYGALCDGTPKVSKSSPLVSRTATINMPRGLFNIDVFATFGVPLTTVGDLDVLIKYIEAGKDDELLSEMTNDKRMEVMDALGAMCDSIQVETNVDVIPCKVSHVDESINLNVDKSTMPSDPIV
ncbi:hypothetical protein Tco_0917107 [Tanacetum coccineum]